MGAQPMEALSKTFGRITRSYFILITVIIALIIFAANYFSSSDIGAYGRHFRRPFQEYILLKTEESSIEKCLTQSKNATANEGSASDPGESKEATPLKFPITDNSLIYPPPPPADDEEYLAVCLLVKDDAFEVNEFVTHHYYHHGIRRFYIYDDGSNPPLSTHPAIPSYDVPSSALEFTYIWPDSVAQGDERELLQQNTMERCIKEHGANHTWMGLLDPDEFVEMRHEEWPILKDWLKFWEANKTVGAMAISWLPHTSAGLIDIPDGGFRKNYDRCITNAYHQRGDFFTVVHSKSFVQPAFLEKIPNIHSIELKHDRIRVGEMGDKTMSVTREIPTHEYWGLHHYATGSRKYFEMKIDKGRSQGKDKWPIDEDYWNRYHRQVHEYPCNEMVGFVP